MLFRSISYREARAEHQIAREFALHDANRDGKLDADEFAKLKAAHAHRRAGTYVADGVIASKVRLALLRAKDLKAAGIRVESIAGSVRSHATSASRSSLVSRFR